MHRATTCCVLALTTAAGAGAGAAGATAAAAADLGPASGVCPIRHLDVRGGKLTAGVTIDNAGSTAARKARCGQVAKVVRRLVAAQAEMPMRVRGYRCTPTVKGSKVAWTCTYRGGKPRTRVVASFAYRV